MIKKYRDFFSSKLEETTVTKSSDRSTIDKKFKTKKSGSFEYINLNNPKVWNYLTSDGHSNLNIIKKTRFGQIVIDTERDKLAGYCFIFKDGKYEGYLDSLTVKKQYRGYGLSNKLVKDAISKYHAYRLNVYKDNEVAINLYKKHGFVIVGETGDGKYNKNMYVMYTRNSLSKIKLMK